MGVGRADPGERFGHNCGAVRGLVAHHVGRPVVGGGING
jgi:hypothetical protein